jgi:hypothetical protein
MDIIVALLMADKQWGSDGRYDYAAYAQRMMNDQFRQVVDHFGSSTPYYYHLRVGNWASSATRAHGTRPSDFIMSHLKVYQELDTNPNNDWQKTIDATYECIRQLTQLQTPVNGLLPGFAAVDRSTGKWTDTSSNALDLSSDGRYEYNACRVPWRLATDVLLYGDTPIKETSLVDTCLRPLHNFLMGPAGGNANGTFSGIGRNFLMNGTGRSNGDTAFRAPVLVSAAAIGTPAQMTDGWNHCRNLNWTGNFYGDYINILSMITASGNYWDAAKLPETDAPKPTLPVLFENGQWAEELGEITVHTPRSQLGGYMWKYENGMIVLNNAFPLNATPNNCVPFWFVGEYTIAARGYDVVIELESPTD